MTKYVRDELKDEYGIIELQDKILEIMVYIDFFCREHEITYYLMGGSALGAMRHGGFVPWDDDLDIFMDYANFKKFEVCCEKYLDTERFYYQKRDTEELPYFFSKIRMNGTTCIEAVNANRPNMHQGIFVDVMCLNNAAPAGWKRRLQYNCAALLKAKALTGTAYHTEDRKKRIILLLTRIIVFGPIKKLLLYEIEKYNKTPTSELAHIFGRAKYKNSFYPTNCFSSGRIVPFEKVKLVVPCNVEEYLTIRYGRNYMKMPSEATKAIYTSHAMQWDTNRDYRDLSNVANHLKNRRKL